MMNSLMTYSRMIVRRNKKDFATKNYKFPKPKSKTIPIFQYPTSQSGNRRVYVWGLADHGALGTLGRTRRMKDISFIAKPSRLYFGEHHKVMDIACGYGFTLFGVHSQDGDIVYGNGINTDSQLGIDESDGDHPDGIIPVPRAIRLPLKEKSSQVQSIAAGRAHSLILTNEGVFTLGNNGYGQCVADRTSTVFLEKHFSQLHPGMATNTFQNKITGIVVHCGSFYAVARFARVTSVTLVGILLTEKGQIYTFGWGADGQTGLAHYRNESQPTLVKGDLAGQNIIKVACVADCVLALSDKGNLFGWGNSEYGQLLVKGDAHQINIATEIKVAKQVGRIVDIAAGGSFCMLLNSVGNVYVWGYGILGFGPEVGAINEPMMLAPTLFGTNEYQKEIRVSKIYCGMSHLGAVTNTGDLYMWGRNKYGSLGLGHCDDQFFPLKVAIGAQVKQVACGVDHTVTICKPFI